MTVTASEARMASPATEEELTRIETAVGARLPSALRTLLRTVGAGLHEHGHEVFGPARLMIHDIELVPDMLSMRARLAAAGATDPDLLPFHRGGGRVHLVRLRGPRAGEVVAHPPGPTYPDVAAFLEAVLSPIRPARSA